MTEGSAIRKVDVQQEEAPTTTYNTSVIPPFAPPRSEQPRMESSLNLNPPVRHEQVNTNSYHQNQVRKTPSLFERITGRNRSDESQQEENKTTSSNNTQNDGFMSNSITAQRKTVVTSYDSPVSQGQQGTLNIDAPMASPKTQSPASDDLDIPAFLRRQIS